MPSNISRILITGGAGYIGSHTARKLIDAGYTLTIVDTLSTGHRWAVPKSAKFYRLDSGNREEMVEILRGNDIEAVIHFAGDVVVPESIKDPLKYYENNVVGSMNLISACRKCSIGLFVFSSSAAVYGNPAEIPVSETTATIPINPYGRTKLITEWNLHDIAASSQNSHSQFRYVALRYFNVAGASFDGTLGPATPDSTHLIKVACETALGKHKTMSIFGTDYPTLDGTCIRDYVHVEDIATAHLDALEYLANGGDSERLNCGYGKGYSVQQVVNTIKSVANVNFPIVASPRRQGDAPQVVADNRRILEVLGWVPMHDNLEEICRTAWEWEKRYNED
ncbi:MAG: UDP-glucose 4-epimerase GalE [Acidiferrobacteraceae bacterium]|nr:UDP-glucose 4-epimerase GalE [Acidiferrobacteraceae bacterium]